MNWIETRVQFEAEDRQLATDLISDAFYALGIQGVVVEGPDADPLEGWGEDAVKGADTDAVVAYLPRTGDLESKIARLRKRLGQLEKETPLLTRMTLKTVDEEDWAESWKSYFEPTRITRRIVIKPSWREFTAGDGDLVIEIDPGMAFGTGTHPTTALCIQLLETHLRPGDAVLDVGTGSGILMIASALLGAGFIRGVDSDPVAVAVARQNLRLNRVPESRFVVENGHLSEGVSGTYGIVVANILTDVILTLLEGVPPLLSPGGIFIGSGIIAENGDVVAERMVAMGFDILDRLEKESWVAIAGRMK